MFLILLCGGYHDKPKIKRILIHRNDVFEKVKHEGMKLFVFIHRLFKNLFYA
jgi:hypothetical protein